MECEYFTEFDTQMMFSVIHTRTCTTSFSSPTIAIFDFDFHYKGHRYPPPHPSFPRTKGTSSIIGERFALHNVLSLHMLKPNTEVDVTLTSLT